MKVLVWPVETYGCESWILRRNEETRVDAFEMNELIKILRVSWTAKKTSSSAVTDKPVRRTSSRQNF